MKKRTKGPNQSILRMPTDSLVGSQQSMQRPQHFKMQPARSGSGIASESALNLDTPETRMKEPHFDPKQTSNTDRQHVRAVIGTSKPRKSSIRIKTDKMSIEGYDVNTPKDSQASKFKIVPSTVQPLKNPPTSPEKPRTSSRPSQQDTSNHKPQVSPANTSFNFFTQLKPARTISSNSDLN